VIDGAAYLLVNDALLNGATVEALAIHNTAYGV